MVLLSGAFAGSTGCDKTARPPAGQGDLLPEGAYPNIIAQSRLDKFLFFGRPLVQDATPDQVMKVQVPVRSKVRDGGQVLNIQYRFEFYDDAGALLTKNERWVFKQIMPRAEYRLDGTSTDPKAYDWRLAVKPAE
jgi:hypothetical protein